MGKQSELKGDMMADKTLSVFRSELKYAINYFDYTTISQKLYNVMIEDKNNGEGGYLVRSLYFDSFANSDFYDKLSGLEKRKKIRLRTYRHDDPNVKLEIKRKMGDQQQKQTLIISRSDAQAMIDLDYDVLLKYESDIALMIYNILTVNAMRPMVLIEYRRKAFIHPMNNIRITLDSEIKSNEFNFDFFSENPVLAPTDVFYQTVLEIKYNNFLFKWLSDIFKSYNLERLSYSKYMVARGVFERTLG